MKICVIGNSHVGAIKLAWNVLAERYNNYSLTFFACGGTGLNKLVVEHGKFVASDSRLKKRIGYTSGGVYEIDPDCYDVFLLYGMGFSLTAFDDDVAFYSQAVKEAARRDRLERSLSYSVFKKLKAITDKPIFIAQNPYPSQAISKGKAISGENKLEEVNWHRLFFKDRASFVEQPAETVYHGAYTKLEFSKGSRKLETGDSDDNELHLSDDFVHMNIDYGRVWLERFLCKYFC